MWENIPIDAVTLMAVLAVYHVLVIVPLCKHVTKIHNKMFHEKDND